MSLRIRVLGPVRVEGDGEITLERASHRRLLSILALHGDRRIATETLIDRFWSERPPPTARVALQTHISALRKLVSPSLIVTEGYGYRLDLEGNELDVTEFSKRASAAHKAGALREWESALHAADTALELWRGAAYAELRDDEFAHSEIARLEELHVGLLELEAEALLGAGRDGEALPDLERLVVEYPLRERLWEHLMTARYRLGRHAEALEAYREAWAVFGEIGVEPSAALRRLEQKILLHDVELARGAKHNLPVELTGFVGRERELGELADLLQEHRMVTLTGVGGSGKTRLALETARLALEAFPDGCWLTELAPLRDPELVATEVARAVGLRPQSDDIVHVLVSAIGRDTILLVLDNCEHLVAGVAEVARALLESGPQVKVLTTSREPLRVPGEVVYDVPPMSFPVDSTDTEELTRFDSVQLFEERAALVLPSFTVNSQNTRSVSKICRRLDGIPLGIELAAARVGSLSPETIAERLDDRFRILVGGSTTWPERHHTLEAAFAWSYDLLAGREQLLFARLSVFRGGFTLDMAEEVCNGGVIDLPDVVPMVSALVEKSLVSTYGVGARQRYMLLETVREYAARRLDEIDDPGAVAQRHLDCCVRFAGAVTSRVFGADRWELFDRLEDESDNLQAAYEWASSGGAEEAVGLLARALAWHWWNQGHLRLAMSSLRKALESSPDMETEAEIRALLGAAHSSAGDGNAAFAETTRAYELVAGLEPSAAKAWVLERHASFHLLLVDRDPGPAVPLSRAALAEARAIGDPVAEVRARRALGRALVWNGEIDEGLQEHQTALRLALDVGDPATSLDTYELSYDLLYLHPIARRSEPQRITEEILSSFADGWATHAYRWWLPYALCQSGEWDRAEKAIEYLGTRHLEGYDRVGYLVTHATLCWMRGRLDEAQSDLGEIRELGGHPRWYHDYYPLVADVAADDGRLADVQAAAERYLAIAVHPTEEARKLAVLNPLARAEVNCAVATTGAERAEHVERARVAVARAREILMEFPPPTEGSLQMETHATHLLFAEAELSRALGPDPGKWREAVDRADYFYFRLYARWRHAEALFENDRPSEVEAETRAAHAEATRVGAEGLRRHLEALATRARIDLAAAGHARRRRPRRAATQP